MPQRLLGVREAIREALAQAARGRVETGWSDAGPIPGDPNWAGGTVFTDRRQTEVAASAADTFAAVARLGGDTGWYGADCLWRLRGSLDHLAGGPGLRRGRRDAERVAYGDAIDFWRVTGVEAGRTACETLRTARASHVLTGTEGSRSPHGPAGRHHGRPTATRPPADPPGSGSRPLVAEPGREGLPACPRATRRAP